MTSETIQSYLISLNYDLPSSETGRLNRFLGEADHIIGNHTNNVVKSLLTWQAGIIGSFTAVTAATVGLVDHVVTADQAFRLQGERMMMGTQQARALDLALKAVGMTLDQAVWDPIGRPELLKNMAMQAGLAAGLGPDYERNMQQLQILEITARGVSTELEYLGSYVVNDLFKALGKTPEESLEKLRWFEQWFAQNMPHIASEITGDLMPVLHDWYSIMESMKPLFIDLGLVFTNFVGMLNGDKSIEGTSVSFEKLGHAIGDVAHDFDRFLQFIILSEKMLAHFALAAEFMFEGKRKDAAKEFTAGIADLTPGSGSVLGAIGGSIGGGLIGGAVTGSAFGPLGTIVGAVGGATIGAVSGGLDGNAIGRLKQFVSPTNWGGEDTRFVADANSSGAGTGKNGPLNWAMAAAAGNIPEWLLHAQAQQESGQYQYKDGHIQTSKVGALGIMQLMPKTAADLHVNPYDPQQNLTGGSRYLGSLLQHYHGDINSSLAAYDMGPKGYERAMKAGRALPPETQNYVRSIEGSFGATPEQHVNISQITVTNHFAGTTTSPEEIAAATQKGVRDEIKSSAFYSLVTQQGMQR